MMHREVGCVTASEAQGLGSLDLFELFAHEVRGPLGVIDGAAQTLELRDPGPDDQQAVVLRDMIRRNVALVSRLLDRVGMLRDLASNPSALRRDPVDLRDLVAEVVADLRGSDRVAAARVRSVAGGGVVVVGDPDAVREILHNLIRNALDHALDGPVEVSARRRDGHGVVQVRDRGPGIDQADQVRVFDLRERARSEAPGRGIGLAFGRALAVAQGGDLRLRPSDEGCMFELLLPRSSAVA